MGRSQGEAMVEVTSQLLWWMAWEGHCIPLLKWELGELSSLLVKAKFISFVEQELAKYSPGPNLALHLLLSVKFY